MKIVFTGDIMQRSIEEIVNILETKISKKRLIHTMGVAGVAFDLATLYGANSADAYLAGLLHDCAKGMTYEEMLSFVRNKKIPFSEVEEAFPELLHAKIGRVLAKEEYCVENNDILNAIEFHTTGRVGMSLLEKILYISDYIEPNRFKQKNLSEIRKMAFIDLDKAFMAILSDSFAYIQQSGNPIDTRTEETYVFYCKENNK